MDPSEQRASFVFKAIHSTPEPEGWDVAVKAEFGAWLPVLPVQQTEEYALQAAKALNEFRIDHWTSDVFEQVLRGAPCLSAQSLTAPPVAASALQPSPAE